MRYCLGLLALAFGSSGAFADAEFEKLVRPLLAERCFECHGAKKQSGGLRLDSLAEIVKGGDSGPALVPGKPDESLLVKAVEYGDKLQMPPKGKLPVADIAALKDWIRQGAEWPDSQPRPVESPSKSIITEEHRKWWAYQPLKPVAVPALKSEWAKTDLDRFILATLEVSKLAPSKPADKRTLLRRVTYDLTGLPPAFEEVEAFVKDDHPDAFAKLVDKLLASPAYGERWGRHWLDVARYADTAGENSDHPTPHAWRYRNWVIDSFNKDQPYVEFVREQVAGDLIAAKGPPDRYAARVTATGFLAIARRFDHEIEKSMHLTYEDIIDTMGRAFLGQSIACARCHDHKYDPFSSKDYYALFGILQSTRFPFTGCEHTQQPRDLVPLLSPAEWAASVEPYTKKLAALDAEIAKATTTLAARSRGLKTANATAIRVIGKGEIADGKEQAFASGDKPPLDGVAVKAGEAIQLSILPLANHGADTTRIEWEIAEVGGKGRVWNLTKDTTGSLPFGNPHPTANGDPNPWWFLDTHDGPVLLPESFRDVQGKIGLNGWKHGDTPSVFSNATGKPIAVWTTLASKSFFAHPGERGPVTIAWVSPIEGKVTITGRVADAHPGGPDGIGWVIEQVALDLGAELKGLADLAGKRTALAKQRAVLVATAPRQDVAYAVTEGKSANARIQLRGDPEKPGAEAPRRWLELFGGAALPTSAGSGRLQLADWLSDPSNPLPARVMANRIWLNHFGKGLVTTPNDFGTRGQAPTHPELLDWLAGEFVKGGWSVKKLHRLIVLSATYQQSAEGRADAAERDPNNALYWRFDRRRLSAEEIRDSLLVAGGKLDRVPGGAHPMPAESTWSFSQHVPFNAVYETDKRSVYLVSLRQRKHPFLALFDGADTNASTSVRQTTTVPTQALYFMNDPFVHKQADLLAGRVLAMADSGARTDELYRLAFSRSPSTRDREKATAFRTRYSTELNGTPEAERPKATWAALARVLLASNEFLYAE